MTLTPGTRIGHFEVLAPLGAGGMGEVYRARDTRLDRVVAIKALPAGLEQDAERLARFEREARLLAALNHVNVAAIHGLELNGGKPYLVLEFVGGETLAQRLERGPLSVRETLDIAVQISSGIEAAHERGIVHRDLKPGNVMLTPAGTVRVLDFGLARLDVHASDPQHLSSLLTATFRATEQGAILGTTPYLSPEQARGQVADRRADVWAFGCVLFECLSGRRPFGGGTAYEVIARILEGEPDWAALPAAVPSRLRELIQRCLVKDLDQRPRDIGDLRRELTALATGGSGVALAAYARRPSLAVLYFENLASHPEGDYFCAGVTEDILTDLSRLTGLRVASRNAVARYRGTTVDIPQVAAELGVDAVLAGSVRRSGDRVRITAQLVGARDGFQLWAERYDRRLRDVFEVQEEIARAIVSALSVALTPAEARPIAQNRPQDAHAYDLYLKGRARYQAFTPDGMREAMQLFRQATAIEPEYALAWAGIADCYGQFIQYVMEDPQEAARLGLAAAQRAIELNPQIAETHKAHALVLNMSGDQAAARAALAKAIEVNPRHGPSLVNLAVHAYGMADVAGANRLVGRALEVDPQNAFAIAWQSEKLWITGRHGESLAALDRLRQVSSEPIFVTHYWVNRIWIHIRRRDLAAAERELGTGSDDGADPLNLRAMEALLAALQDRSQARTILQELHDAVGLHAVSAAILAIVAACALVGDVDSALRWSDKPLVRGEVNTFARLVPELRALLDLPPFAPRRREVTLVWPSEAPPPDPMCQALFHDVRIESGIPQGTTAE